MTSSPIVKWQNIQKADGSFFEEKYFTTKTSDGLTLFFRRKKLPKIKHSAGAVILIHGFAQNSYTWHNKKVSFENYLAFNNFDVYNIELRGHGLNRNGNNYPKSFEDFVFKDMPAFITKIKEISGEDKLFLIGHSLGGAVIYASSPLFKDSIRGIVTIAGVYYFGKGQKIFSIPGKLLTPFDYLIPKEIDNIYIPLDLAGKLIKKISFVTNYKLFEKFPFQGWFPGTIDKEILKDRITDGFDRTGINILRLMLKWAAKGSFLNTDETINYANEFNKLNIPLLVISGNRDLLCTHEDAYPAYLLSNSKDKEYRRFTYKDGKTNWGHIDLISGTKAPEYVWAFVESWLKKR